MPSKSRSQQRLFQAAEHGATFPLAEKLRKTLTHQQLHDFASGPMKGKPNHVHKMNGRHDGMYITDHHRGAKK